MQKPAASLWRYFRGRAWARSKPYVMSLVALFISAAALLYLSHSVYSNAVEQLALDEGRDYTLNPFDMGDALRYCQIKTERQYGSRMTLSYIDDLSTRFDHKRNLYKVFMVVHAGDARIYHEESVRCFVDPERRVMTHYRTINLRHESLMNRALKFFQ